MPEEEIERITGAPLKQGMNDIHSEYDFNVRFDVRDTDPEFVMEKLKSIVTTVVPLDTGGVIDRNKLVKLIMEAISPDAARELVIDQTTASQKLYKEVVSDVGMMMLGNEAQYVENDPSAPTKMQYLQEIMQKNPKAQQAAQGDQIFQILLQNYSKNLQMSIEQQKNKEIGRIGVSSAQEDIQAAMAEQEQGQGQEQQMQQQAPMPQQGGVPPPGQIGGML
jgi:preprotein translocase subunit SecA